MRYRSGALAIAIVSLGAAGIAGQAQTTKAKTTASKSTTLRTPWGDPDLQGTWDNKSITPLERPKELAGKEFLSPQEAAELEKKIAAERVDAAPRPGDTGTYNQYWFDRGTKVEASRRTSLIVDPPDGRMPSLTPEGQKAKAAIAEDLRAHPFDGPENLDVWDRCITRGLPMFPAAYNNNFHILQVPGHVAIVMEMIHDVRMIPLDGRPHIPQNIRNWMGDSRGRWDGNTLVVDTTNFNGKTNGRLGGGLTAGFPGLSEASHLIERFTRVDGDTILYETTIEDPSYTKPWTASMSVPKSEGSMFEYACQEGNYSVPGILAGARAQEKAAAQAPKKPSN